VDSFLQLVNATINVIIVDVNRREYRADDYRRVDIDRVNISRTGFVITYVDKNLIRLVSCLNYTESIEENSNLSVDTGDSVD